MDPVRKKIPTIDFRPRRQIRFRYLAVALLLLGGVVWCGWQWISPYDRALVIEKQLDTAQDEELRELLAVLPSLEAPGYRVLFGALGHPQPEVRRRARTAVNELIARWQREPSEQPGNFAELTILLAERVSSFKDDARLESQDIFRRWVNLPAQEKVSASLAQREFHARRLLLDWIMEPRLAQPPRLRGQERAERRALMQQLIVGVTSGAGSAATQTAANLVSVSAPSLPRIETKYQVVAVEEEVARPTPVKLNAPDQFIQAPPSSGGLPNQAAQLSRGPNSEAHPNTPLTATSEETPSVVRRAAAHVMTSADLLSTDAPARYRQAAPSLRQQLLADYQAAGVAPADLELLELYASAAPAVLAEHLNELPRRTDVASQQWLRQFAVHPDSMVRRMAWSWLITSPDRATKQWLAERAAMDSDGDLREWYQTMTKQRKTR